MIRMEKKPGKDFVILNISDLQVIDEDWDNHTDRVGMMKNTLQELVERANPDLITITGDLALAGEKKAYRLLAELLDQYQIPWAPVWGNHDNQDGPETVAAQLRQMRESPYLRFEEGDPSLGSGNYTIAIYEGDRIVRGLIMMDSHDRYEYTDEKGNVITEWGHLYPAQLDWYREQVKLLNGAKSILMKHIPFLAYKSAIDAAWNPEYDRKAVSPQESTDSKYWNNGYKFSLGVCHEDICCYPRDDGMFPLLKQLGSTEMVLVGHDHINNFVIPYEGVVLAYALKTGSGCYWEPQLNGGTVLRISDHGTDLEHLFVTPRA